MTDSWFLGKRYTGLVAQPRKRGKFAKLVTEDRKSRVVALYQAKKSQGEIAKALSLHRRTIGRIIASAGLK